MSRLQNWQARPYLKGLGFSFKVKPTQLQQRLLKMTSEADQETLERVWEAAEMGVDIGTELYSVPRNLEQASTLFSHDAARYVVSMTWVADVVKATAPLSLVDVGCGAGILLNFLQKNFPAVEVNGIDASENLVRIGSSLCGRPLIHGDYLTEQPDKKHDLVICEFGYDNSDIPPSTQPHSAGQCGMAKYCPGCAEDAQRHFQKYMKAWRRWATAEGALALVGRMTDYTDVRAVTLAAKEEGWFVRLDRSKILTTRDEISGRQRFPAWYFTSDESAGASDEDVANFFATGKPITQNSSPERTPAG